MGEEQAESGDGEDDAEDVLDPDEAFEQLDADDDEEAAEGDGSEDSPEEDAMLLFLFELECPEHDEEDEEVVDGERGFDEVSGGEFEAGLMAGVPAGVEGVGGGDEDEKDGPEGGGARGSAAGSAMEQGEVNKEEGGDDEGEEDHAVCEGSGFFAGLAAGFSAGRMDHEGDADADQVESEHGSGEDAHGEDVRGGGNDGGDDEDDEDGVAEVLPEEFGRDDAEEREEEDDDGELKGDAEAEDYGEEEVGVLIDFNEGTELAAVSEEKFEGFGIDPAISEVGAAEKEADAGGHEGHDVSLFMGVEAGGDEHPDLVKDVGSDEDAADHEADLEVHVKGVDGVVVDEFGGQMVGFERENDGRLHEAVNLQMKCVCDEEADEDGKNGANEAAAEFFQVLHEGHAWELGAL